MIKKDIEKKKVIELRLQGKTYSEILEVVKVSKSSLSLWLKDVGLAKAQKQRLTEKRYAAQLRGGAARRNQRITSTAIILKDAKEMIGQLTKREKLLIGAALYWAEGSKEKTYRPSVRLDFANSDPDMIRFYVNWLHEVLDVHDRDIQVILHIHENRLADLESFKQYWLTATGLKLENYAASVIKRHKPKTKRHNITDSYHGLVAIRVKRSTILNRRTSGWIHGIIAAT